ncbi:MAG: hypothetical protein HY558_01275 [Euryarchaeota archaeon]|nr:hypothetical protein [Euryarchaeota archaeon]
MDERRPHHHNPLDDLGVETYKEAPEEAGSRVLFTFVFTLVAVLLVLLGAGFIVDGLVKSKVLDSFSFFGIIVAGMGLIVNGLTIFDTFWYDRYLVHFTGLMMSVGGIIYAALFATPALPPITAGFIIILVGLVLAVIIGMINAVGWVRIKKNRVGVFAIFCMVVMMVVIVAGWIASTNPRALG